MSSRHPRKAEDETLSTSPRSGVASMSAQSNAQHSSFWLIHTCFGPHMAAGRVRSVPRAVTPLANLLPGLASL